MIVKEAQVKNTRPSSFEDNNGNRVQYFQVVADDGNRLHLLSSRRDYDIGDIIDIAYDSARKRYTILEFDKERS